MTTASKGLARRGRLGVALAAAAFVFASLLVSAVPAHATTVTLNGTMGATPGIYCHATARTNSNNPSKMTFGGWNPTLGDQGAMWFYLYARNAATCGPGFAKTPGQKAGATTRVFRQAKLIGVVADSSGWAARVGDRSMIDDQLLVGGVHPAWLKALKLDIDGPSDSAANGAPDARISRMLTNREHEVLSLLMRARDNRSIAHSLGIAEATVKRHVSSILTKFGSKSRSEASLVARQLGYAWD